jgi:hypothetical protein
MEELKEESFKNDLFQIINAYSQKGLTIGTQYYILKDVFGEVSSIYQQYINQQLEKRQKQEEEIENNETIVEEGAEE